MRSQLAQLYTFGMSLFVMLHTRSTPSGSANELFDRTCWLPFVTQKVRPRDSSLDGRCGPSYRAMTVAMLTEVAQLCGARGRGI